MTNRNNEWYKAANSQNAKKTFKRVSKYELIPMYTCLHGGIYENL